MTINNMKKHGIMIVSPIQLCYYDYDGQKSIPIDTKNDYMIAKAYECDIRFIYIGFYGNEKNLPVICFEVEKPEKKRSIKL